MEAFSKKQKQALSWWCDPKTRDFEAIICDGAVRSGKTVCMGMGFFFWAMGCFENQKFAICGRSTGGVRRNLVSAIIPYLEQLGFRCEEKVSKNLLEVSMSGRKNTFYYFGGKDESSSASIQGVTLAGVLLDEVALMPQSFVEQAVARCSVEGSRLWFSCNPEGPGHWFYREWICKAEEKQVFYLHFTMEDNPGISKEMRQRYERRFLGAFYQRFIQGLWVAAEGLVYGFFSNDQVGSCPETPAEKWRISCDYGTVNPASFGLWGLWNGVWYRVEEYYYNARKEGRQKTDGEYAKDLAKLADGRKIERIIVDPSAASFIELLKREGWTVQKADNDVLSGIRTTAELLKEGKLVICEECRDLLREFGLYRWDERFGDDRVRKEHDHAMDDMRYFAVQVAKERRKKSGGMAGFVERGRF